MILELKLKMNLMKNIMQYKLYIIDYYNNIHIL